MANNAAAPGDLDGVLADLLHRAVAAHVEEVGLEVLAVTARLSTHQEQRTSETRGPVRSLPAWLGCPRVFSSLKYFSFKFDR